MKHPPDAQKTRAFIDKHKPDYPDLGKQPGLRLKSTQTQNLDPNNGSNRQPLPPQEWERIIRVIRPVAKFFKNLLIVDPKKLHGTAYVSPNLEEHSRPVGGLLTVANLLNAGTAWPLLLLTVKGMPFGLGYVLATATNIGLVIFSNQSGTVAAVNAHNKKVWSFIGLCGVIGINLTQSLIGGISIEVLLNQANLSAFKADKYIQAQVIDPLEQKINRLDSSKTLNEAKSECRQIQQKLDQLDPNTPKYRANYEEANGTWKDNQLPLNQRSYYQSPVSQWPWCIQVKKLTKQLKEEQEKAQQKLEVVSEEIASLGSVAYIHKNQPEIYASTFKDNGNIRSEIDQFSLALQLFFQKIVTGKWTELGLSLYIFSLSVLTSGIAVCLIAAYAKHEDIAISWSEAVNNEREQFFDEHLQAVIQVENALNNGNGHHQQNGQNGHKNGAVQGEIIDSIHPDD